MDKKTNKKTKPEVVILIILIVAGIWSLEYHGVLDYWQQAAVGIERTIESRANHYHQLGR